MLVQVTQSFTRTAQIEGSRTVVIEVDSIDEARRIYAEEGVDWEEAEEEATGGEMELGDTEFEAIG